MFLKCQNLIFLIFIITDSNETDSNKFAEKESINSDYEVFDSFYWLTPLEYYPDSCLSETCAENWLVKVNEIMIRNENRIANVYYRYATNITSDNLMLLNQFRITKVKYENNLISIAKGFPWQQFHSKKMREMFEIITTSVKSVDPEVFKRIIKIKNRIEHIYNKARPCYKTCLSAGESGIVNLFNTEKNYDTLLGYWIVWRKETGVQIRDLYIDRFNLEIQAAKENGIQNIASFKMFEDFQEENFLETLMKLFDNVMPIYKQLHAYVRYCLAEYYPDRFNKTGPIPAHILGDVWAQNWINIFPIIKQCSRNNNPFHVFHEVNFKLSKMSMNQIFKTVESNYVGMGMYQMTNEFWERSLFTKPNDRIVDCHSSSEDFSNGFDFRVKMCSKKTVSYFSAIHHEMGHIQYFMAYQHLPILYRASANSAFQEIIGDTMALSMKTLSSLEKIGLLSNIPKTFDLEIDYLMLLALENVPFVPFAMINSVFVNSLYNGSVPTSRMNSYWWKLVHTYQGIKPPIERTEENFDPGSKYHIAFGIPYIRHFVSSLLKFQFFESLCEMNKKIEPLHFCTLYQSKNVGSLLIEIMKNGQRKPWREIIKIINRNEDIQSDSLLRFFAPLTQWLIKTNKMLNIHVGW